MRVPYNKSNESFCKKGIFFTIFSLNLNAALF